jgi:pyruvate carboxylase subunit A
MFNKILIANRGEVAIRVMRACRELGIATVAVYSEADNNALFTKYADEAYLIGPPPTTKSYLNIDAIIEVAKRTGAQGIHPGYGFLSENAAFAKRCEDEGITFIGPSSEVIKKMGSKISARQAMIEAGVPVVPGDGRAVEDVETAREIAGNLGYPLMIKASAGGGGIGINQIRGCFCFRGFNRIYRKIP